MELTTVKEIYRNREQYLDKEITVGGWVRSVRDSKAFGFIVLHDGSFFETLQIVKEHFDGKRLWPFSGRSAFFML